MYLPICMYTRQITYVKYGVNYCIAYINSVMCLVIVVVYDYMLRCVIHYLYIICIICIRIVIYRV